MLMLAEPRRQRRIANAAPRTASVCLNGLAGPGHERFGQLGPFDLGAGRTTDWTDSD
jgi:hypothetical protein